MNIEVSKNITQTTQSKPSQRAQKTEGNVKFSDELKTTASKEADEKNSEKTASSKKAETEQMSKQEQTDGADKAEQNKAESNKAESNKAESNKAEQTNEEVSKDKNADDKGEVNGAINGLEGALEEINKLNRTDEKGLNALKLSGFSDDKDNKEDFALIDNNMNIQEPKDKINLQMGGNTNFTGDGQPFAEFVNPKGVNGELKASAKDLAEEKAILSTMEENVAIANKNMAMSKTKTVSDEHGIKKVDKNTNVTVDTIVNFDTVVMDKSDVDFFLKLTENGVVDMKDVQGAQKSSAVSKTLADLLAKSMNENKPVRIDFDNNISVIIKISREGKISADFLPSSQVAEAYLKENLPLLKQRFDEQNIEYDELNQRKQKQDNQDDRKKGRKDE